MLLSTAACAQTQEYPPLGDIPPTYDMPEDQFVITLPMVCVEDSGPVFDKLEHGGYNLVFLGQTKSQAGGDLFVSVFMHKEYSDYYILITNSNTGGVCEVTSGDYGQIFSIDKIGI